MLRRDFFNNASALATGLAGSGIAAYLNTTSTKDLQIPQGLRILFQGDSITDAGRDRGDYYANRGRGMGGGYVYQIVSELLGNHPGAELQCFNRGISGHKVFQLADRWDLDCLALRPDVLSILIGVNDFWHMINGQYDGTVKTYEDDFRQLLQRTREALPDVKLIIGEPFAVEGGSAINEKWSSFHPYRLAAKDLAAEFDAAFIPYHSIFSEALRNESVAYWCPDGVHPSIAGAHLMQQAWLKAFSQIMM
ncbi:MAG: SGNH/GDSL hydrolase family protein [Saprospiraceae bacterium]|nr:SGNH/GDSL hydrolase family protein [Saprospiraceae bacterium]